MFVEKLFICIFWFMDREKGNMTGYGRKCLYQERIFYSDVNRTSSRNNAANYLALQSSILAASWGISVKQYYSSITNITVGLYITKRVCIIGYLMLSSFLLLLFTHMFTFTISSHHNNGTQAKLPRKTPEIDNELCQNLKHMYRFNVCVSKEAL